tara:strand:- start:23 stop:268 length:246 start_codon:yes stop_codon:yes gene_type:complete
MTFPQQPAVMEHLELNTLCEEISAKQQELKDQKKTVKAAEKDLKKLQARASECLKEMELNRYTSPHGTLELQVKESVSFDA